MSKKHKIALIAGGGTGGHLFPALAIGNSLEKENITIKYIGSKHGIEKKFFNNLNKEIILLDIKGINRNFNLKSLYNNILFPIRFIITYFKSILIIKKLKPSIIIGTGGYCSGLPLLAATHMKVPTLIQDQNSIPGLITRKLHNKVSRICLAYKESLKNLNKSKCKLTGNPLRKDLISKNKIDSLKKYKLNKNKKTILILGGSQGARPINNHFVKNYKKYINKDYQLLWQCGDIDYNEIKNKIKNESIILKDFISDMSSAYSSADIVISRAGALSISELTFMQKAMILIPYPHAAENHQQLNAKSIAINKACLIINQNEIKSGKLEKNIFEIMDNDTKRKSLEKNAFKYSKPDATKEITKEILKIINE